MYSHYYKDEFPALGITVIGLMILSGVILLFGGVAAVTIMLTPDLSMSLVTFVLLTFGPIVSAFLIFALAEMIQLFMKIELNTRKGPVKVPAGWRRK